MRSERIPHELAEHERYLCDCINFDSIQFEYEIVLPQAEATLSRRQRWRKRTLRSSL
jgi:hypothetical protein